ncbi:MAG: galactokinase [Frankiales bacterium]|nr:galactokinase [Frankiales bacterium]
MSGPAARGDVGERSWRAPGRVNLIGEHTDYNEGFCLPLAIEQGCTATASIAEDGFVEVSSAQRDEPIELALTDLAPGVLADEDSWAGYVLGVVWALRERGHDLPGLSLSVDGNVPLGAGLSSSAALECSVAAAVSDLCGLGLTPADVVAVARQAENDFVGAPTGGMDQLASVFGQAGHALLCDMRTLDVEALPFDPAAAGLDLLVLDSRAPHRLTDGGYGERRRSCEQAAELLGVRALRDVAIGDLDDALNRLPTEQLRKRARHVITENDRTLRCAQLLRDGRLTEIGPLLTESHHSLRDDFEVSTPQIDLAVQIMGAFDAIGARITGGGFGGCAIGLLEPRQARAAAVAIRAAFDGLGFGEPVGFTVVPSAGLRRIVSSHL